MKLLFFKFLNILFIAFFSVNLYSHELDSFDNLTADEISKISFQYQMKISDIKTILLGSNPAYYIHISNGVLEDPNINKDSFNNFLKLELKNKMPQIEIDTKSAWLPSSHTMVLLNLSISGFYIKNDTSFYMVSLELADSRFHLRPVFSQTYSGYCDSKSYYKTIKENIESLVENLAVSYHGL